MCSAFSVFYKFICIDSNFMLHVILFSFMYKLLFIRLLSSGHACESRKEIYSNSKFKLNWWIFQWKCDTDFHISFIHSHSKTFNCFSSVSLTPIHSFTPRTQPVWNGHTLQFWSTDVVNGKPIFYVHLSVYLYLSIYFSEYHTHFQEELIKYANFEVHVCE